MSNRLAHVLDAKWRSDDINIKEARDFSSLNLDERILTGLRNAGYKIPSPVQLEAIPMGLTGSDVFVQGKTGTGKTLVFSILALTAVLKAEDLLVLIIAPTREGAFQIYNTILAIGSEVKDLKCECFIGGFSFADDLPKAHECKIAVGTPGRMLHLLNQDCLDVDDIHLLILDDFDELLNKHRRSEMNEIFHALPETKQTIVATLTCTDEVMQLASEYLKQPFLACCNENELSLLGMAHFYYIIPLEFLPLLSYRRKLEVLKSVLFGVKFSQCVIFCNSVHRVEPLCIDVQMWGFSVASISKAKDQVDRLQAVELLRKNRCKVFVSTDVSSRGLDAENVDLVINFDMPPDCRTYLRRCGRAGRYGAKCSSITFLLKNQTNQLVNIKNEGHFNTYALPEPIPEDLHCFVNPNMVSSLSCNLSTSCSSEEDFLPSSTEFNKIAVINLEKTAAGEGCSLLTGNENEETGVEGVGDLNAKKIEEQADDVEIFNTSHLMADFEKINLENECADDFQDTTKIQASEACFLYEESADHPNNLENLNSKQELEVCSEKCGNKNCEQSSCKTAIVECAAEVVCSSSDFKNFSDASVSNSMHYDDTVAVSSECKSLPLNNSFATRETSEIETEWHLKKTDSGNECSSFEEMDLSSSSKTASKSTVKSSSKMSKENALHKAFDKMHLEREGNSSKRVTNISKSTQKKKNYKNTRNICNKETVKFHDNLKSQSSERQVMLSGLKTTSSEFVANHSCAKYHSRYPANHVVKKKGIKNPKIHSTYEKYNCLNKKINIDKCCGCCQMQPTNSCPKPSYAFSSHCYFPNNSSQPPPFLMHRDDMFYKQWMFINSFSHYLSYYFKL